MDENSKKVKLFYEHATDVYLNTTGYYLHGCAAPEGFNLPLHILNLLNVNTGGRVLDAGCGTGMMLIEMSKIRPDIRFYGITISERQFEICNELKLTHQADNVTFVLGDFHQLTNYFEKESMDAVYFNESLFHTKNLKKVLNEVKAILKTKGTFYSKDIYISKWLYTLPLFGGEKYKVIRAIIKNYHYYPRLPHVLKNVLKKSDFYLTLYTYPPYISVFKKLIDFEEAYGFDTHKLIRQYDATHWRELLAVKK